MQYRKLLRALHNLRTEVLEPAPGPRSRTSSPTSRPPVSATPSAAMLTGRRLAYAGGIAAATAAGAAGALLFARNGKRVRVAS